MVHRLIFYYFNEKNDDSYRCALGQAQWAQEGLQSDNLSVENGAILSAAARWPLMIDPQIQGIKWIIEKESENNLHVIQLSQPKYIEKVMAPQLFEAL